jgi:hypothetical protein
MDFSRTTFSISNSPHGLHGESMWSPHGVYMDLWTPWGLLKQCFMDSTEIIHGLLMDSMRNPRGLREDSIFN